MIVTLFRCRRLFLPSLETERTCVAVEDGRVAALLTPAEAARHADAEVIDLTHGIVGPGLVDIHCHGAMGSDFADGTEEDISTAALYHLRKGTTSLLAAIGSCSLDEMRRACAAARALQPTIRNLLGVHLEGPYFSSDWFGCHRKDMIRNPAPEEWRQLEEYRGVIRLCTVAPELPGALEFIRHFTERGIVFSIGHSAATYDEIRRAMEAGLTHSTHVYCAMPKAARVNLILQPGVLESVLMLDELTTEIIGDGIHVGPRLVEFVCRIKGTGRIALVSDSLRGVGCGPGDYAFGPRNGQVCRLVSDPAVGVVPDRPGILASSAIVLSDSLRILSQQTTIRLEELWKMASIVPARILGMEQQKGSLTPGRDADFLVLDDALNVSMVFARGRRVAP
jgi:N-acetylglucosamine-6-phosphate deacetylase